MEFEAVRDIIVETLACDAEQVTLEASLAAMELIMALEDASGVKVDDADVANLKTVADIVNYLNNHKA